MNYNAIAARLDTAAQQQKATYQTSKDNTYSIQEAYAIQSINVARRYLRGQHRVGLKMGFTSKAKMEQMGVHDLIWGKLTSDMQYADGGTLQMSKFIHPRAEPEIAFRLKHDLDRSITRDEATEIIDSVAIAIEIIDSRYEAFKFSLEDVIADNCSSAGFVLGNWCDVQAVNDLPITLTFDGEVIQSGNSNAILGDPYQSLVDAVRLSIEHGEPLTKDLIILAGAATPASYIKAGSSIEASAGPLGSVSLNIVE